MLSHYVLEIWRNTALGNYQTSSAISHALILMRKTGYCNTYVPGSYPSKSHSVSESCQKGSDYHSGAPPTVGPRLPQVPGATITSARQHHHFPRRQCLRQVTGPEASSVAAPNSP